MSFKTVDVVTLKKWLENDEAVLIDVRELNEYQEANIPGAYHLPLASVSLHTLPNYVGKKLVLQCRSGRRSAAACEMLLDEDIEADLYNLEGGILAWQESQED